MGDCEDCGRALCRDCDSHYCIEQCPCGRSHTCDCACNEYLDGLSSADDATAAVINPSEKEAAATLARECTDHAAVILWCADRVRSVEDSPTVQDAADYLHDLSTRAQVDTDPVTDRAAVIRWCAQQIHSVGGDADVQRAAEYLDDLAVEAQEARDEEQAQANLDALVSLVEESPAEAQQTGTASCWCGHPKDRHWEGSDAMTFRDGCHDCPGWNGAHAYGQELPWLPEGEETP